MTRPVAVRNLVRFDTASGARTPDQDLVAVESPLTVRVQPETGASLSLGLLMRTPGHDEDLALGALLAEGVINSRASVIRVESHCIDEADDIVVYVTSEADLSAIVGRGSASTSACGLCGRLEQLTVDASAAMVATTETPMVTAAQLMAMPELLRASQAAFADTGGLHAAGLFAPDGTLHVIREDVGRHNAVDKVAGALLRGDGLPAVERVLVVSGRVAYEIVQKAARCGVPVILAVGAPTDLAVDAARAAGITLAGFARGHRFNAYTWAGRIAEYSP